MGNDPSVLATTIYDPKEIEKYIKGCKATVTEQNKHGWSKHDHSSNIDVTEDRLVAKHGHKGTWDGVRGRIEYTSGIHFFTVKWNPDTSGEVVIGIATKSVKLTGNSCVLGADDQSVGWNLLTKELHYNGCVTTHYPSQDAKIPSEFGLILNMDQGTLAFKSNEEDYGVAQSALKHIAKGFHIAAAMCERDDEIHLIYQGGSDKMKAVATISAPLAFHETCGENVVIGPGKRSASRLNPNERFDKATVLTNRPLQKGEYFRMKLDKKITAKCDRSLQIGVTTNAPAELEFPEDMSICGQGKTWVFTGPRVMHMARELSELNSNLEDLREGQTAGVKLEENKIQFYMNGYKQISIPVKNDKPLYGFIDIFGMASGVSIIDADYKMEESIEEVSFGTKEETDEPKEEDTYSPKTVEEFMDILLETMSLMSRKLLRDAVLVQRSVNKLNKVYIRSLTEKQRVLAAERLAMIDGPQIISNYLNVLKPVRDTNNDATICYTVLRDLSFNYSGDNYLLCKKLGEARILEDCINDMRKLRPVYKDSKQLKNLLKSGMGILKNCVKAIDNQPIYMKFRYIEIAKEYIDPAESPMWACLTALFTMSYIYEEADVDLIKIPNEVAVEISDLLKNALREDSRKHAGWNAIDLIIGISNLAGNSDNVKMFVDNGMLGHILKMLEIGNDYEKEHALNALWCLISDRNKKMIISTKGLSEKLIELSKSSKTDIKNATVRVLIRIQTTTTKMLESKSAEPKCKYLDICKRFVETMGLSDYYFDTTYNRCYCIQCHSNRGERTKTGKGNPRKDYGVPVGWCRFGLGAPPKAKALNVFTNWHRAYHGTKKEYIGSILEVGEIVPAGRAVIGGAKIKEEPGHFSDDRKPRGFDTKQVFLSPSIRYSGVDAYAKPSRFYDRVKGRNYLAKVAFQVVINPDSYVVGPETIGATKEIDPGFRNEEMEWSTNQQGSLILYGLLVKLEYASSSDRNNKNSNKN